MILIEPDLILYCHMASDGEKKYTLHSKSVFMQPNIRYSGEGPVLDYLDCDNKLQIELLVAEDFTIRKKKGKSTVTHVLELGSLDFGVTEFDLEISVYDQDNNQRGRAHISNTAAKEVARSSA